MGAIKSEANFCTPFADFWRFFLWPTRHHSGMQFASGAAAVQVG